MIKVFTTLTDFTKYRSTLTHNSVGLVATMGNLHEGHLSLLNKSISENTVSLFTIFVNPKQFAVNEDLDKYPRTLKDDLEKIAEAASVLNKEVVVFAPASNDEVYPEGFSTTISVGEMTQRLEGKIRPTHFDGVTTVVYRLFQITKPNRAYFGQKDFQQCVVIKKMVRDLSLPIDISIMPIIRNADGLALSSRNQYLSEQEKREALIFPATLKKCAELVNKKSDYTDFIKTQLKDSKWDYLEVLDSKTFETPLAQTSELVIVGAYRMGSTRLLDNILVTLRKHES